MKYILILTLSYEDSGSISQHEYNSKEACEVAADIWLKQAQDRNLIYEAYAICVPKG